MSAAQVVSARLVTNKALAVLSATCVVVALAGCGTSDSSVFAANANRVCGTFYAEAYALAPPIGLRQLQAYPEKQQALLEGELSGLRALKAPGAQRHRYTRYVADLATLDKQYSVAVGYLRSGGPGKLRPSVATRDGRRLADLHAKVDRDARDLGLAECAKDPYSATHYG